MVPLGGDTYRSDPAAGGETVSRICTALGLPFLLYPRLLGIVFGASWKAVRGRYGDEEWVRSSLATIRALEAAGCRVEVEGLDRIRRAKGPLVFVGNHMSTLETFALPCLIQPLKPVTFVVKKSLMTYPVFGPVMRSRNPISVGRANPREDYAAVMEQGFERLAAGISVIVFPQTSRSTAFDPADFNSLGVKLARRAGVPILPLAIRSDAWENGRRFKDMGRLAPTRTVHIRFGDAMPLTGNGAEQHTRVIEFILGALAEWGIAAPAASPVSSSRPE